MLAVAGWNMKKMMEKLSEDFSFAFEKLMSLLFLQTFFQRKLG